MSFRSALLLLTLLTTASLAQEPPFLPEGIEATGDTAEVRALTAWAEEHQHSHPEQVERVARRALAFAQELDDQRGIGETLTILGELTSDPQQKEAYYTAAQEAFEQIGDKHSLVHNRRDVGTVYELRGDLEQALVAYFDALEGFERLGDTEGQAGVLSNIGIIYKQQGHLEEARPYYMRAVDLAETLDNPILLANNLNNLAGLFMVKGSYEAAETHFRRALAIYEDVGSTRLAAIASLNLGVVFNKQGQHEHALPYLEATERLSKGLGEDRILTAVYDELGRMYMGLNRYDRALHYAKESLTLAQNAGGDLRQLMAIHETLSQIYEAAGNDGQALAHYRRYAAARDSVFSTERTKIISEMQTRYETEEKQRAIERLEQENRIQALQSSRWRIGMIAGIGGLLLLLGFLYYRYRVKQRANHLLEELDAAKSRFFANISHEFRTPLTVILGGLQDALAGRFGTLSEKLANQNQAMLRNTRQLQGLIDEVLDLNRLEAGKLTLQPVPGDLVPMLRRLVEADAPLAERNGIELTFDHDVAHCPRRYDKAKVEKIVGNLFSNALKFTPKGGAVQVELRSGKETEIIVTDNGPGIPAEMQGKVFERFEQGGDGSHHGGTGIGLALAKELAELHDGTITLESAPGEGSTFTVRLSLERTTLDEIEAPRQQNTEFLSSEEFSVGGDGHEKRQDVGVLPNSDVGATLLVAQQTAEPDGHSDRTTVLVIEDNDDVRAYVRRSLEETYRVLEAADGETGLQQAREALPDLIVSDIMLPGIDGYEVARRLKAEATTECIPVVMLTARAAEEDQTEGYGSGAEVYITKPFSSKTLQAACTRLLEERLRLRRRLQERSSSAGEALQTNGKSTLRDRARAALLEHPHEEAFGVEELATALGMSRSTLYRRVKEELGLSAIDFARILRLEHARELLADGAGSVSEVAYAVGFSSLSVFSRAYRTHYGVPPSSHIGREKTNASE